ncbi:MAG: AMP-binding protein, partial [bacterium]
MVLLGVPNNVDSLKLLFSTMIGGAVPALVAPGTPSPRLNHLAKSLGARAVAGARLPGGLTGVNQRYKLPDIQVATFARDTKPNATPGEVILLTSGTTGFASGCVFTLEQLLLNAQRHADSIGQREGDIVLLNLPLHYSFALVAQALTTLVMGGRLVVTGPPFHVPSYLEAIDKHGVTISSLTPVLVRSLLQNSTSFPPSLRVLTVGGDVLGRQHVKELLKRRPGRELYLTYGLTQAGPRVSTLAAHREPGRRFESVGLPIAGTHV